MLVVFAVYLKQGCLLHYLQVGNHLIPAWPVKPQPVDQRVNGLPPKPDNARHADHPPSAKTPEEVKGRQIDRPHLCGSVAVTLSESREERVCRYFLGLLEKRPA